jgi:hypothetical protein
MLLQETHPQQVDRHHENDADKHTIERIGVEGKKSAPFAPDRDRTPSEHNVKNPGHATGRRLFTLYVNFLF